MSISAVPWDRGLMGDGLPAERLDAWGGSGLTALRRGLAFLTQHRMFSIVAVLVVLGGATFSSNFAAGDLSGRTVVLDPGHGGGDEPGTAANGVVERDSNLDMAQRVRTILDARGARVVLTRNSEARPRDVPAEATGATATFIDLQSRVAIANAARADVVVSIHSNSYPDSSVRGADAWYTSQRPFAAENWRLATLCLDGVNAALRAGGYPVRAREPMDDAQLVDAAGRGTPMFVIGPERDVSRAELVERGVDPAVVGMHPDAPSWRTSATQMPGTLLELLYISNPDDAALLKDERMRYAIARGIADGIARYLGAPAS